MEDPTLDNCSENSFLLEESESDQTSAQEEEEVYSKRQRVDVPTSGIDGTATGFSLKKLWAFTGPGFLMSIAYIDPGNIESDLQAGSVAKYKLLWILWWSTVFGLVLQLLAARLGVVTGKHLAQVCRDQYPKGPRLFLWIMMELAIIGSDIQEVIGSAVAISLLSSGKIPLWAGALMTGIDTFTFLFLENYGLRKLEAFFGALITTMSVTFGYLYIASGPDQLEVLKGVVIPTCPDCNGQVGEQAVSILGAVIMPHNIYLHSALVLSRNIDRGKRSAVKEGIFYNSIESAIALFVSFIINMFVVCVFAELFAPDPNMSLVVAGDKLRFHGGCTNVTNGTNATSFLLSTAANSTMSHIQHCKTTNFYWIIWGIGLLAAGQSSTMTGTYAGQFVMEGFLGIKWPRWKRVLLTRSIAMGPTILCATVFAKYLDALDEWLNVEQSLLLPFALLPVLHLTTSSRIMGDFKNSKITRIVVWFLAVLVMAANGYLIVTQLFLKHNLAETIVGSIIFPIYIVIVIYYVMGPSTSKRLFVRMGLMKKKKADEDALN